MCVLCCLLRKMFHLIRSIDHQINRYLKRGFAQKEPWMKTGQNKKLWYSLLLGHRNGATCRLKTKLNQCFVLIHKSLRYREERFQAAFRGRSVDAGSVYNTHSNEKNNKKAVMRHLLFINSSEEKSNKSFHLLRLIFPLNLWQTVRTPDAPQSSHTHTLTVGICNKKKKCLHTSHSDAQTLSFSHTV